MGTRISIVTPCFNQAETLERTIRSVVNQQCPDLEYIVVDGGSSDGTSEILSRYALDISTIISEPDNGQYDAIRKGFDNAHGDIFGWLNGDDIYCSWTLSVVKDIFDNNPTVDWITGLPSLFNNAAQCVHIKKLCGYPQEWIASGCFDGVFYPYLQQECMFWRASLWHKCGGFDPGLTLAADFELWTRFARHTDLVSVTVPLGGFLRREAGQRSIVGAEAYRAEVTNVTAKLQRPFVVRCVEKHRILSELYRHIFPKKSRFVAFSSQNRSWRLFSGKLVTARLSIRNLFKEWRCER